MRILHLSWEYPPVVYGGLGRHVHALAETQAAAGDDVVVITQAGEGAPDDEVVNGVRILRVRPTAPDVGPWQVDFIGWTFGFNVAVARAAFALLRQWRPDVVHGHDWLVAQAAVLVQEAATIPFVLTIHATEAGRQGGDLTTALSRAIDSSEWWGANHADRIIVCSEPMRSEVARLFAPPGIDATVIANGIEPRHWRVPAARRSRMRRELGSPLVVYAGRLESEKGVQTLIDAVPALRRRVPGVRVVVIGHGTAGDSLRRRARERRVGRAVTFTGWVPEDDLRAIVAAADAAVVPSLYEPFGFVALEAMVLGAPLVVARTGGLADIVEDGTTGWLFEPGSADQLADVLVEVLGHPRTARRRAVAARVAVVERFGWPAIAGRTGAVYAEVLGDPEAGQGRHPGPMPARVGNLLAGLPAGPEMGYITRE